MRLLVCAGLAVLAALLPGCWCCSLALDLDPQQGEEDEPPPDADEVDLGTAYYPAKNRASPAIHPWWLQDLDPKRYRLTYRLTDDAAETIGDDYHGFANKVGHKRLDKDRFQWRPPPHCMGGLHCVYDVLVNGSEDGVQAVTQLFRKRARDAKLTSDKVAALVITFVQEIEYRIPESEPFGVMPPALVVKQKWGDCDSKTLLAHMILRELGIRSVLISSEAHKHTMLGLAMPSGGQSFTWQGTKYAFVELTAKRSPIGHVHPQLLRPDDWQVVSMQYKAVGKASESAAGPPGASAGKKGGQPLDDVPSGLPRGGRIRIKAW